MHCVKTAEYVIKRFSPSCSSILTVLTPYFTMRWCSNRSVSECMCVWRVFQLLAPMLSHTLCVFRVSMIFVSSQESHLVCQSHCIYLTVVAIRWKWRQMACNLPYDFEKGHRRRRSSWHIVSWIEQYLCLDQDGCPLAMMCNVCSKLTVFLLFCK